jgi:hypothetical protein
MRFCFRQLQGLGLGLALISLSASGQQSIAKQSLPAISNLRLLSRNAGYIFDGTVLSVERVPRTKPTASPRYRLPFALNRPFVELVSGKY